MNGAVIVFFLIFLNIGRAEKTVYMTEFVIFLRKIVGKYNASLHDLIQLCRSLYPRR